MGGERADEGEFPGRSSAGPGRGLQGCGHAAVFGQRHPRPGGGVHFLGRKHLRTSGTIILGAVYLSCSPQPRRGRLAGSGLSSAVCGLSAGAPGPTEAQGVPRITCPGRLSSGNRGGVERARAGISEKDLAAVNPSQPAGCALTSPRCFSYRPGDEIWKAPGIFISSSTYVSFFPPISTPVVGASGVRPHAPSQIVVLVTN